MEGDNIWFVKETLEIAQVTANTLLLLLIYKVFNEFYSFQSMISAWECKDNCISSVLKLKYKMVMLHLSIPNFCWAVSSNTSKE